MEPLLEVRNLKTQFFTPDGIVKAVDGVSFQVAAGETLGIAGESGCGKSVSALSIMRLIPSPPGKIDGQILFEGQDLLTMRDQSIRSIRGRKIGMIFQDPMTSLNPVLSINQQISEVLQLHLGMSRREARQRAIELLTMVGIPNAAERIDQYPHQFSGGMRQRVMIAIAVACGPALLIADEPTTALDVTIQAQILDLLRALQREHRMALILITHDLGVLAGMAGRILVMYAGRVVEAAPTGELFANPRHPYTAGLLSSVPRLDAARAARLAPIRGQPPDLIDLPEGCPFAPRCDYAQETCRLKTPSLLEVRPGHQAACWYWEAVSKEGPRG